VRRARAMVPVLTLSAVLVLASSAQAREEDGQDRFWDAFRDAAAFAATLLDRFVPGAGGPPVVAAAPAPPTQAPSGQKPETLVGKHPAPAAASAQVDALLTSAGLVPAATPEVARQRFPPGALADPVDEWLQRCTTGLGHPVPPGCGGGIRDWLGGSMAQLDQLWGRRPGPEPVVGDARPFQLPELTDPDLFGRGCGSLC